jgi:rod shape-determining protein MreC
VVGEILSVDMDPLRHRVMLNRGGRDGAYEGQALIDARGVVGQITRDQRDSSAAILITDPDHALPVEIVRNGLRSIAVGTGDLKRLSLPFLTRNADIKIGDLLITSGLGGAFPAGYPVGRVTQVDGSSGDAFLEVSAVPTADLDRLHEVLLVFLQQSVAADAPADAAAVAPSAVLTPKSTPAPVPTPTTSQTPTPAPAPAAAVPAVTEAPGTVTVPVVETAPGEDTAATSPPGEALPATPQAAAPDPATETRAPEGEQE